MIKLRRLDMNMNTTRNDLILLQPSDNLNRVLAKQSLAQLQHLSAFPLFEHESGTRTIGSTQHLADLPLLAQIAPKSEALVGVLDAVGHE